MSQSDSLRDAILLVAGIGSRLRPLTDDQPKCLLEIGGVPLLIRLLRQLHRAGIDHAVLATGYLEAKIRACVAGHSGLPAVSIRRSDDFRQTNNAATLHAALSAVDGRPFILCDGDILVRPSGWMSELVAGETANKLAMISAEELAEEDMKIALAAADGSGQPRRVVGLSKELDPAGAHGESVGVQTLSAAFIEPLAARLANMSDAERADAYYEDIFAELLGPEHPFFVHRLEAGDWTEIDTPADLEHARQLHGQWQVERR